MLASEFIERFDPANPAPVYLLCPHKGPRAKTATFEPLLAARAAETITKALVDPSMRDFCYSMYYADDTAPGEIVANAQTLPFLVERQVIELRGAEFYETEAAAGPLIPYLANPADSTVLVITATKVDKRSKFYKACEKRGELIECGALSADALRLWVHAEVKKLGKTIEPGAVRELTDRAGGHLSDVVNAVTICCNYVGERTTITADDVAAACADVAEEMVWGLTDAIAVSNTKEAMRVLWALRDAGKNEFEILGLINWLIKTAYAASVASSGGSSYQSKTNSNAQSLAAKFGTRKLRDAFRLIADTDFMFRSTGVDRRLALELLVVKLAAPRPRRRPAA